VGVVASVGLGPSPLVAADQLRADPEVAIVVPLGAGVAFSVGGGVLVQADNVMRAQAGLSWTF
jgi:enoyl-CoA hydratase/carnithine racemase